MFRVHISEGIETHLIPCCDLLSGLKIEKSACHTGVKCEPCHRIVTGERRSTGQKRPASPDRVLGNVGIIPPPGIA